MQVQKDDKRQKILEVATSEFIANGFNNASMRTIANKSHVVLSNIYNYFTNKDEIFNEIVAPVIKALRICMLEYHSMVADVSQLYSSECREQSIRRHIALTRQYRDTLRLLLYQSQGSSHEHFREEFTDIVTGQILDFLHSVKERYPETNTDISEFFIHTCTAWELSIYGEIVTHELSEAEIEHFITEYVDFSTAGWRDLIKMHQKLQQV